MKIQLKHENCVRFSSIVAGTGTTFVMIVAPLPYPLPILIYLKNVD